MPGLCIHLMELVLEAAEQIAMYASDVHANHWSQATCHYSLLNARFPTGFRRLQRLYMEQGRNLSSGVLSIHLVKVRWPQASFREARPFKTSRKVCLIVEGYHGLSERGLTGTSLVQLRSRHQRTCNSDSVTARRNRSDILLDVNFRFV